MCCHSLVAIISVLTFGHALMEYCLHGLNISIDLFLTLVTHRACACDTASIPICALKIVAIRVEKLGRTCFKELNIVHLDYMVGKILRLDGSGAVNSCVVHACWHHHNTKSHTTTYLLVMPLQLALCPQL